ncbi:MULTISPECIES: two-component system response regulator CreB [unclassified Chromobacterium]|uniref:two-component system response regulator CreB n=1 Tax=unclassified Chromobacterium TaxID=2641838 RepID=UPI000D3102CE|nr:MULTISPECIES: two-component system response regulator CreB [unclassified Chromobacterium]MCP1290306.1 two-component system response regulator CreB [Chromobacterium sp. S0633]PTU64831.1 two-component system response regulator CreB [Chromobacterium sp. Panama]UJB30788.1 two-component system response regulator CreB [Chromobacterium sp. Beijing]
MKPLIWLAEDEAGIADTLIYTLETDGFDVEWFERGLPLLERLERAVPALCILDVGLPDINGFDLCRRLRERADVPLMFLTARSEEMDRIIGLEIGADDYVAKPFSPREVSARARTILRRYAKGQAPAAAPAPAGFELDEARACVHFAGRKLNLTRYEYLLLKTLLAEPGRVFSRQQLMERVWRDAEDSFDRTVDTHVKTLRAKLRDIDPDAQPIQTHRGLGYSLGE